MKATNLVYLNNTFQEKIEAEIIAISNDDDGYFIVLNDTIMYPQGGGQETDYGIISDGSSNIEIHFVGFDNGIVKHYTHAAIPFSIGSKVKVKINIERRIKNSKLHTAGHLISNILYEEYNRKFIPIKGYHFYNGSYVEFEGIKPDKTEEFIAKLNHQIKIAISKKMAISSQILSYEELKQSCSLVPEFLPKDKPLRIVTIGNFEPIPCGGTHINNLDSFQSIYVSKIKNKKGRMKVSYKIE